MNWRAGIAKQSKGADRGGHPGHLCRLFTELPLVGASEGSESVESYSVTYICGHPLHSELDRRMPFTIAKIGTGILVSTYVLKHGS